MRLMLNIGSSDDQTPSTAEILYLDQRDERRNGAVFVEPAPNGWSYAAKLGRETIWLERVEFLVLKFLAAHPYEAFSRARIVKAVSTDRDPVTAETLGRFVASLRLKLGFFGDYIQSVPHIGYRFRA